ncbi:MAG: VOC family protein [Bacteroidetes bacterium]|nr:VOC family protein [Bacteroidota bacterium]
MKTIELISVPVTDQEVAKKFYVEQVGFSIITESNFGSQKWIQLGLPGSETSITLVNWFPNMPAGSLQGILIKTDDIERDVKALQERGVAMGKIDTMQWGKFAGFKDPDGNGWSLHQM